MSWLLPHPSVTATRSTIPTLSTEAPNCNACSMAQAKPLRLSLVPRNLDLPWSRA